MSECPGIQMLERWAAGDLSQEDILSLTPHVSSCDMCREQLEECRANHAFLAVARPVLMNSPSLKSKPEDRSSAPTITEPTTPSSRRKKEAVPVHSIPGYEIIRELHRGGQGVVYEAIQLSTKRKVAIKVLLEGSFASASSKKRFEREIELVASLRHPNVISIYHPGQTPEGHPFYVMDYVRGLPLHQYVRNSKLTLKQALGLFIKVCDAVGYAHQRGVIHRDLKPTNILVDTSGDPKVLDFGLAKQLGGPDASLVSQTGQVVGTLPYVSPEQARGNPEEIDTRTDIYALGVMLYQVLTGDYPYPVVGQLMEVLKHIAETEPTPPSKAWNADSGIGISTTGRVASRLHCPIDNEVETILLKALAKEPERRYQSVGELGQDLQCYLDGKPIDAKRDSGLYVMKKLARRYRVPITIFSIANALVAAALLYAGVQKSRAMERQAELDVKQARSILAAFSAEAPREAIHQLASAGPGIRRHLPELCGTMVASASFTDRINGARSGLLVNPDAFWASVDGGPLWENGEWLEVALTDWDDISPVMQQLHAKAVDGTERQRYAALCLIGQMASPHGPNEASLEICRKVLKDASHPGVITAAKWAAQQLGSDESWPRSFAFEHDSLTGLTFVHVEGSDGFARGAREDDPDRWSNEQIRGITVGIEPFYISTTEVTLAAFREFFEDTGNADLFGPFENPETLLMQQRDKARQAIEMQWRELEAPEEGARRAVDWIGPETACRYCDWLNRKAAERGIKRQYRLPTEAEWEYAAMAGGKGRYCFGNMDDYVRFFAACRGDGEQDGFRKIGQRMPSFFGTWDCHGGLWEWVTVDPAELGFPVYEYTDESGSSVGMLLKGGAYYSPVVRCRPSQRNRSGYPDGYFGLRLVMEPGES